MTKIDLITGFLGSGKTTFLKIYAGQLIDSGLNIGILENDYGAVNVDMMLLQDLEGDSCELEMVAGACDADCHKRRFKTKLIALGMSGLDRVIVEPSGIFDVDEFFDVLREEPLNRMYEIGSVIAIVDARLSDDYSCASDFYLASQIANAGAVLLSRAQLCSDAEISNTIRHLEKAGEAAKLDGFDKSVIRTDNWFELSASDIMEIADSGYKISSYEKRLSYSGSDFTSLYFMELPMDLAKITKKIPVLMGSPEYGNIFRIKGFFQDKDQWYEVNATSKDTEINPIPLGQEVIIIIGENLNKEAIEQAMND